MPQKPLLPQLPLTDWEASKMTLHLYLQIVGKIRLVLSPRRNHWWNITLYVTPRGLSTHAIPAGDGIETFVISLDLVDHRLDIVSSTGETRSFPLLHGLSVAQFYAKIFAALEDLGIRLSIIDKPFDLPVEKRFSEITEFASYDPDAVNKFWRILLWVDGVFNEFSGRFYGKTCPVHLYWHHMDLAVTRFSGKKGPEAAADMRLSDKDAYSHEAISFGFWAGDETVPAPAFYSYTYPAPSGLDEQRLEPASAKWVDSNGSPMALLMYDDLREMDEPRAALLAFLESSYQAGARKAGWDVDEFSVPPLDQL